MFSVVGVAVVLPRAAPTDPERGVERLDRAVAAEQSAAGRSARREEVLARAEVEREVALDAPAAVLARVAELALTAGHRLNRAHREPAVTAGGRTAVRATAIATNDVRTARRDNRRHGRLVLCRRCGVAGLLSGRDTGHGEHAESGQ